MNKAYILLITFFIMASVAFTDYYNNRGLDTIAYAVAVGLDKGENNSLKLSMQFAVLSGSDSQSSTQAQQSTVNTVECDSINSGINILNSYIGKTVNLSHCKAIVISEEVAYLGISEYICTFINNVELRPNCDVIISKCNAEDFLNSSKPVLESMSARYYELALTSSESTGYTEEVILSDFFINMLNEDIQPFAILGGINSERTQDENIETTNYSKDESYTAVKTPISGDSQIENMGLAVFHGDKLVGELTGIDCICHLIITNKLDSATISIPSPFEDEQTIALEITQSKNSSRSVNLINNTPFIQTNSYITARVLSLSIGVDYTKEENLIKLEEYANNYLENSISTYLYKTSKEFNSDIVGFGKDMRNNYSTIHEFLNSDWLNNYENSFFKVNVESSVIDSYLFTKIV